MSKNFDHLREEAKVIESSFDCAICDQDLKVVYDHRKDRGVCIECGFPYKIDVKKNRVQDFTEPILYSSDEISSRHIRCIKEYKQEEDEPALLWSHAPFKSYKFIEFSEWASENGYEDLSWV